MQITVLYVKMLETYDATATPKENQCFAPLPHLIVCQEGDSNAGSLPGQHLTDS